MRVWRVCVVLCVYSGEGEGWECGECVLCCVCTVEKVRGGSVVSVCCAVCVYSGEGEGWSRFHCIAGVP